MDNWVDTQMEGILVEEHDISLEEFNNLFSREVNTQSDDQCPKS